MPYVNFIHYAWGALMVNQFEGYEDAAYFPFSYMQPLDYFGLESTNKWAYLGYESIFIALFFILACTLLGTLRYGKR